VYLWTPHLKEEGESALAGWVSQADLTKGGISKKKFWSRPKNGKATEKGDVYLLKEEEVYLSPRGNTFLSPKKRKGMWSAKEKGVFVKGKKISPGAYRVFWGKEGLDRKKSLGEEK